MPAPANLVHQTTTGTGTGNLTLTAVNGKRSFNTAFGNGVTTNVFDYFISSRDAAEWERGTGHMSDATTLVRDTVIESSNANAAVSFTAGTKDVTNDVPAGSQYYPGITSLEIGHATDSTLARTAAGRLTVEGEEILSTKDVSTALTSAQKDQIRQNIGAGNINYLFNPSGEINQAGVGSQSDGTYDFDQWIALTQSNPVTASQLTDVEDGTPFMMRLSQANASAQRFGRIQWLEKLFCRDLRGQAATLSARVRMSASTTLRYAVVSWTGTADSITKDVVNDWTSGTFTAGNFFNSTTLTVEGTGSIALTANTLTDITPLTIAALSSSMNNLAVIFWTDSTQAQNVTLDVGKAKLERGTKATPFSAPDYAEELWACKRYWELRGLEAVGQAKSTTGASFVGHGAPKRVAPTFSSTTTTPGGIEFQVSLRTGSGFSTSSERTSATGAYSFDSTGWSSLTSGNLMGFQSDYFILNARL